MADRATRATAARKGKTTAKGKGKGASAPVTAEVARVLSAAASRGEELIELIERRKATITESFYEIGKALKELQQKKLYASLGYPSLEALLRGRGVFGVTQAGKLIQIVSTVPIKTALELGPEKAFALIRYAATTPELDTPQSLVESGAKIGKVTVTAASVRDITEATKRARAKAPGKKVDPEAREAERAAKQGHAWLEARGVRGSEVAARRAKGGFRLRIDLPLEAARLLFGKT